MKENIIQLQWWYIYVIVLEDIVVISCQMVNENISEKGKHSNNLSENHKL